VSGARLTAARARARGGVEAEEVSELAALEPGLWRVVEANEQRTLTVATDMQLHHGDVAKLPAIRLSATQAKTLLAVLVATATGAPHPYPGGLTTVGEVLTVLDCPRLGESAAAHVKGSLKKLHLWRLARLDCDGDEVTDLGNATAVRVGPAVASWSGPWIAELTVLVAQVVEQRRRSQ
jgi:hypothetical protein